MIEFTAITEKLKAAFGDAVGEGATFRGQDSLTVAPAKIAEIATFLRDDATLRFDMLTDLTAVDYMGRTPRFTVVYNLYSFQENRRLRLKCELAEGETIPTVEGVWKAANWLEREVYDLYGIAFDGHADLRRILLWDGYVGHPLRKDFPLTGIPQAAVYK